MELEKVPAFILTAGLGTRLRPFTNVRPKPCIPFLGLPLFSYPYSVLRQAGCQKFFFNLHYEMDLVRKTIQETLPVGQSFDFFEEKNQILGSGGALWNGRTHLENHPCFFVANGDEFLLPGHKDLIPNFFNHFQKEKKLATLLVTDHPELLKTLKPVWINEHDEVIGFGMEKPASNCQPVHYTGFKIFSREIFDFIPEGESNIFYDVVKEAIAQEKKVDVFRDNELTWSETGNINSLFKSLKIAVQAFKEMNPHLIQTLRSFGMNPKEYVIQDSDDGVVLKHRDTFLPPTTKIKGVCFLDRDCKVGIHTELENVIAEPKSQIVDRAVVRNQIIFQELP